MLATLKVTEAGELGVDDGCRMSAFVESSANLGSLKCVAWLRRFTRIRRLRLRNFSGVLGCIVLL